MRRTWQLVGLGFGTMLLLHVAVTIATVGSISGMRKSIVELTDAQRYRREQISRLRSQLYISSIMIRDYLLDRNTSNKPMYRQRLADHRGTAGEILRSLESASPPASESTVASLSLELDAFWRSISSLLDEPAGHLTLPYERIRANLIPRREAAIALAEELGDAAAAEALAARNALNRSLHQYGVRTIILYAGTIVSAIALALLTTTRVFRLERMSATEHQRVQRAEATMRSLSQQLVTSQEQERRALSRELHDHVGQMVTSLRFCLSDLESRCESPSPEFGATLAQCRITVEQTIEAIRSIAMGLRPSMLDDLGLGAAIEWQAREFSKRFNVPVHVNLDSRLADWPEPERTALYRVAQEALTNCARHAKAKAVRIDLQLSRDAVKLCISDDGIGLRHTRSHGFGLLGMEERVREIGGVLNIRSAVDGGTEVEVLLPTSEVPAHV